MLAKIIFVLFGLLAVSKSQGDYCPDGTPIALCFSNPCVTATCSAYPEADCETNFCGSDACTAQFFVNGEQVTC
ncbi:hypothetical protein SNE40_017863 [Patella caerulea]|uniref:Uncharacterized protein n=1 Tax=Patella caerulea TaxID=87958 RepID=A0AAN8JEM3_PATCE